ncbi:MAG: M14 family metallopeptidase [Anaerostipes sp.]|jgi:predicted deacylase|nr:M14 family metallopeptidase [Anaerostipes sp.]
MREAVLYETETYLRQEFQVHGFYFGCDTKDAEDAACIVGSMRGNEYQQLYICSMLVQRLKEIESSGAIVGNNRILIVPSVNNSSMNVGKKFWVSDNSDINREFPGNYEGEPTSRLAANLFEKVQGYRYGIHFPSFYKKGDFIPHVRMPATGKESVSLANLFGLPYVVTSKPRNYDNKTLNYTWQTSGTDAFSVYSGETGHINEKLARQAVSSVLRFLTRMGIIKYNCHNGYIASIIEEEKMIEVQTDAAGFFRRKVEVSEEVSRGQLLGEILDPYEGDIISEIRSQTDGIVFFAKNQPVIMENTAAFQIIKKLHQ